MASAKSFTKIRRLDFKEREANSFLDKSSSCCCTSICTWLRSCHWFFLLALYIHFLPQYLNRQLPKPQSVECHRRVGRGFPWGKLEDWVSSVLLDAGILISASASKAIVSSKSRLLDCTAILNIVLSFWSLKKDLPHIVLVYTVSLLR